MTDEKLVMALRALLCAEVKPQEITPLDLLQIARLLIQRADEKDVYASQETLAEQLCSSADSIARSQERLNKLGWLIIRKGGYRGRTNMCSVELEKLPIADLHRTVVSEQARHIASQYGNNLRVASRKKFMRGWLQQWSFQIQKLIDRSNGDAEHVCAVMTFAFTHIDYAKRAAKGPAELRRVWRKLSEDYKAQGTVTT